MWYLKYDYVGFAGNKSGTSLIWTHLGPVYIVIMSEVSLFENNMYFYRVGTQSSVLINQVTLFQRCPLRENKLFLSNFQSC